MALQNSRLRCKGALLSVGRLRGLIRSELDAVHHFYTATTPPGLYRPVQRPFDPGVTGRIDISKNVCNNRILPEGRARCIGLSDGYDRSERCFDRTCKSNPYFRPVNIPTEILLNREQPPVDTTVYRKCLVIHRHKREAYISAEIKLKR